MSAAKLDSLESVKGKGWEPRAKSVRERIEGLRKLHRIVHRLCNRRSVFWADPSEVSSAAAAIR